MDKASILLVDDDKLILKTLENLLTKEGYKVTVAEDGQKAIEEAKRGSYQLIIVDCRMPGINGIEAIKQIKQLDRNQGVSQPEFMVITGYADDDAPKEAIPLGIGDFLVKPFERERFLETVRQRLAEKREDIAVEEIPKKELVVTSLPKGHFILEKQIFLKDTNLMGNTYFANYALWQGEAREACLLSHPRFKEEFAKNQHIKMITHSLYHRFVQETTFGDVVQIKVSAREVKRCSFVMVFRYFNKSTGAFLGEGWQRVAFIDQQKGSFVPIPKFIRELTLSYHEGAEESKKNLNRIST